MQLPPEIPGQMQAEAREGLVAEIRKELQVEIEARVALAQRLEHKSEEAARLERQNAVLLQHLREGGAREEQVREAVAQRRDAAEKLQRALAVNSKLRAKVGMLEQELEVSRGARAELEKSMNVQDLLDSAELNSTEAIHSSMAQISAALTPVEALGPLGELGSHLNSYRAEWSKAQAPIELEALRGAFAHLSSKLQEAEASRQEAANAVVQMQVDLQKREQERAAAAEQDATAAAAAAEAAAAAAAAAAAERSLPQVVGGVPMGAVGSVPLPSPPTTSQPDFSFANAPDSPLGGAAGGEPDSPLEGFFEPVILGSEDAGPQGRGANPSAPPTFPAEVGPAAAGSWGRTREHTPPQENSRGNSRHSGHHRSRSHRKGGHRRTPKGVADIQRRLQEIQAARQRSMDNFSTEAVRQLAEQEMEEDRLKRKLNKLMG